MAFHFSSHCMLANLTSLPSLAGVEHMHSRCSSRGVSLKPPLLQVTVTLLTIDDASELVYLATTLYNSLLALAHFSLFASTNASILKISSRFLTPSASAAFNSSANSPFIPATAVLIFIAQFCHWSSPHHNVSMLSNPLVFNCWC